MGSGPGAPPIVGGWGPGPEPPPSLKAQEPFSDTGAFLSAHHRDQRRYSPHTDQHTSAANGLKWVGGVPAQNSLPPRNLKDTVTSKLTGSQWSPQSHWIFDA